jgi:VRR-NUC domain
VTEKDLQTTVIELALLYGWRVSHQRPARTAEGWRTAVEGHPGLPDLIMARGVRNGHPARLLLVELKTKRGKLSADQKQWFETLVQVPRIEVRIWTPEDLEEGRVQEALK